MMFTLLENFINLLSSGISNLIYFNIQLILLEHVTYTLHVDHIG